MTQSTPTTFQEVDWKKVLWQQKKMISREDVATIGPNSIALYIRGCSQLTFTVWGRWVVDGM